MGSFFQNTSIPEQVYAKGNDVKAVLQEAATAVTSPTKNVEDIIAEEKKIDTETVRTAQVEEKVEKSEVKKEVVEEPKQVVTSTQEKVESTIQGVPEKGTFVIPKGVVINGGVFSNTENTILDGEVNGEIKGMNVEIRSPKANVTVSATGIVKINRGSVVIGKIQALSLENSGALKGTINVHDSVVCKPDSVIVGDICTGRIEIEENAVVKGEIKLDNISINESEIFGE